MFNISILDTGVDLAIIEHINNAYFVNYRSYDDFFICSGGKFSSYNDAIKAIKHIRPLM